MRLYVRACSAVVRVPLNSTTTTTVTTTVRVLRRSTPAAGNGSGYVDGSSRALGPRLGAQVEAIHGYRETERASWGPVCEGVLRRVKSLAFPEGSPLLGPVHVLDLDKAGYIKPHIDSIKFCGSTIAGLSLLSDSVMRLVKEDDADQDTARYGFTHEILKDEQSAFRGARVPRQRRISVICRNLPTENQETCQ
ncbi:hypothetical protein CRUP_012229 [Coryphaenoides rupestris]|nr:hypothetical protein CRUP_012229 [Coryphaenoides rupestris]